MQSRKRKLYFHKFSIHKNECNEGDFFVQNDRIHKKNCAILYSKMNEWIN